MREIVLSDARQLSLIHGISFEKGWSEDEFRQMLETEGYFGFVSEEGFILGRQIIDEVEIFAIAVLPEFRRKGIGSKLLKCFEIKSRIQNVKVIFLEVNENNIAAQKLYISNGYVKISTRANYYGNQKAIIMRLQLI